MQVGFRELGTVADQGRSECSSRLVVVIKVITGQIVLVVSKWIGIELSVWERKKLHGRRSFVGVGLRKRRRLVNCLIGK